MLNHIKISLEGVEYMIQFKPKGNLTTPNKATLHE